MPCGPRHTNDGTGRVIGADVHVPGPVAGILSARLPASFQLDLRLDGTWTFETWRLMAYVEASNLTNRANVEAIGHSYNYRTRNDTVGLPLIPTFGVRGTW